MLLVYILDIVHMPHILSLKTKKKKKTLRLALQLTHAVFDNKLTP